MGIYLLIGNVDAIADVKLLVNPAALTKAI